MYVPESEDEQLEQLKGWLRDYGPSFIIGVVLALAIGFGWGYWQKRQLRISQSASSNIPAYSTISYKITLTMAAQKPSTLSQRISAHLTHSGLL